MKKFGIMAIFAMFILVFSSCTNSVMNEPVEVNPMQKVVMSDADMCGEYHNYILNEILLALQSHGDTLSFGGMMNDMRSIIPLLMEDFYGTHIDTLEYANEILNMTNETDLTNYLNSLHIYLVENATPDNSESLAYQMLSECFDRMLNDTTVDIDDMSYKVGSLVDELYYSIALVSTNTDAAENVMAIAHIMQSSFEYWSDSNNMTAWMAIRAHIRREEANSNEDDDIEDEETKREKELKELKEKVVKCIKADAAGAAIGALLGGPAGALEIGASASAAIINSTNITHI